MLSWWIACSDGVERSTAPLANVAYVWQPTTRPEVRRAMDRAGRMDGFALLAGEIGWDGDRPVLTAVPADAGRPVEVVVRIRRFSGDFEATAPAIADLVAARASEIEGVQAVQLDFDAPTRVLASYPAWIRAVQERVDVPVTITALPTWLSSDGWDAACAAADGVTVQVHTLEPPSGPGDLRPLFVPAEAVAAAEAAARCGRPTRVALPTYRWTAAFDGDRWLGVVNEREPPAGARLETIAASPADAIEVLRGLEDHPANLEGVAWFRLPVDGDRAAWTWPTLEAVMDGREPEAALSASCGTDPLVCDLVVRNDGDADAGPHRVVVTAASVLAADAVGDYTRDGLVFSAPSLRAGASVAAGWVRLAAPGVSVEVQP